MALKESGSVQTEPMEGESLLARLNAFGERHAKVIIFVSVALLIATVLIFAKVLYDRSVLDRASKDIAAAYDSARLLELKARYAGTRAEPEILYRLANRYYEENKLDEARAEYTDFVKKFPGHPLEAAVQKALLGLTSNLEFLKSEKTNRQKALLLQTHPQKRGEGENDPRTAVPSVATLPVALLELSNGTTLTLRLFEDDAPNTVANFVNLAEKKYFEGLSLQTVRDGAALRIGRKEGTPAVHLLPAESVARTATEGTLVMLKAEGRAELLGAEFEILLKEAPELKEGVIFGRVISPSTMSPSFTGSIKSVTIEKKRQGSKYEPVTLQP